MNVTCMPIACFMFWLFTANTFFQFLSCGIRMYIPILTMVQKRRIAGWKMVIFAKKNILLKLNLQDEGHLHANCLFYILYFCFKYFIFQLFSCCIRMHVLILPEVQKKKKVFIICKDMYFWNLISNMKVICILNAYFIFWLFTRNAFFFSSLVVACLCTFPS